MSDVTSTYIKTPWIANLQLQKRNMFPTDTPEMNSMKYECGRNGFEISMSQTRQAKVADPKYHLRCVDVVDLLYRSNKKISCSTHVLRWNFGVLSTIEGIVDAEIMMSSLKEDCKEFPANVLKFMHNAYASYRRCGMLTVNAGSGTEGKEFSQMAFGGDQQLIKLINDIVEYDIKDRPVTKFKVGFPAFQTEDGEMHENSEEEIEFPDDGRKTVFISIKATPEWFKDRTFRIAAVQTIIMCKLNWFRSGHHLPIDFFDKNYEEVVKMGNVIRYFREIDILRGICSNAQIKEAIHGCLHIGTPEGVLSCMYLAWYECQKVMVPDLEDFYIRPDAVIFNPSCLEALKLADVYTVPSTQENYKVALRLCKPRPVKELCLRKDVFPEGFNRFRHVQAIIAGAQVTGMWHQLSPTARSQFNAMTAAMERITRNPWTCGPKSAFWFGSNYYRLPDNFCKELFAYLASFLQQMQRSESKQLCWKYHENGQVDKGFSEYCKKVYMSSRQQHQFLAQSHLVNTGVAYSAEEIAIFTEKYGVDPAVLHVLHVRGVMRSRNQYMGCDSKRKRQNTRQFRPRPLL